MRIYSHCHYGNAYIHMYTTCSHAFTHHFKEVKTFLEESSFSDDFQTRGIEPAVARACAINTLLLWSIFKTLWHNSVAINFVVQPPTRRKSRPP